MTGAGTLLRFMLRRSRRSLPVWVLVTGFFVLVQSQQSQSLYGTPEKLAALRRTLEGSAAIVALSGPVELTETIGGEVAFEMLFFTGVLVALMNMFLVAGNTRGDEEAGRTELLRSLPLGRHAPLWSAVGLAAIADLLVAALVFLAGVGTGLPAAGSLLFGALLGLFGLVFAGIAAVAAQVVENTRAAYGATIAVLGVFFALRAAGDAGDRAWLSWLSPMGWTMRALPYVENRWWVLGLLAALAAVLLAVAVALLDRRDFGGGLVAARLGAADASPLLGSPLGLVWRLQRGALLAWAVGAFATGAVFGSLGNTMEQYVADNPEILDYLPGGAAQVVDSFLAVSLSVTTLLAVGFCVSAALRARGEEADNRAEIVLSAAVSRVRWLGSYVVMAGGAARSSRSRAAPAPASRTRCRSRTARRPGG